MFWLMWVALVVFAAANAVNIIDKEDAEEQVQILIEKNKAKVSLVEYKTIVNSLDRCNERLYEVNNILEENDYLYQQTEIVDRFMPDTTEGEAIQLCHECSLACEERLFWCYYYRDEACICDDIVD